MAPDDAQWHAIVDDDVVAFASEAKFLAATRTHPFAPEIAEAVDFVRRGGKPSPAGKGARVAANIVAGNPNRVFDAAANAWIPVPPGCTELPPPANITVADVTTILLLRLQPCLPIAVPYLWLWPAQRDLNQLHQLAPPWAGAVRSARSWY
jgi:hypothetical protein